jgi:hypothetical protein
MATEGAIMGPFTGSVVRLADRFRGGLSGLAAAAEARRHVKVLQNVPLGPGSRLLVVEFEGRRLLIGQGRGGLVRLDSGPDTGGGEG